MPILYAFKHASVRLKLCACERKHTVNGKSRIESRTAFLSELCPLSHPLIVAQDRYLGGMGLFLKQRADLENRVPLEP